MINMLINFVFYLLVAGAGVSFALQQAANNHLRAELVSPWWAGFISYAVGSVVMLIMALVSGPALSLTMITRTHLFSWTGGVFGAIYIATAIFMIPKLGATTVLALMVVGQMVISLFLDHYGILGIPIYPISGVRLIGVVLLVLGVVLVRW